MRESYVNLIPTPAGGTHEAGLRDLDRQLAALCRKLADAIDYGHENNVPAKLVDPVRRAQKAVSDALLPAPSAA